MVFIFVASAFFATANGAIPALAVYEDATQALAQLFTLGAGSLSIAFVAYSIMANQDFSSLIYGGVRSRAAEKEMKAELGEEVSEEDDEEEEEEEEAEEGDEEEEEEEEQAEESNKKDD